jgi:hypothetical protein
MWIRRGWCRISRYDEPFVCPSIHLLQLNSLPSNSQARLWDGSLVTPLTASARVLPRYSVLYLSIESIYRLNIFVLLPATSSEASPARKSIGLPILVLSHRSFTSTRQLRTIELRTTYCSSFVIQNSTSSHPSLSAYLSSSDLSRPVLVTLVYRGVQILDRYTSLHPLSVRPVGLNLCAEP